MGNGGTGVMRKETKPRYIEFEKGQKFVKKKDAQISPDVDAFQDAGIMLAERDLVIDIDDIPRETIEALIVALNINTEICWTDRGAHLFFDMPREGVSKAQGYCKAGMHVEYKKKKNKSSAVTRRRNGKTREVWNQGMREDIPDALLPFKKQNAVAQDMVGVGEGGRNGTLFSFCASIRDIQNMDKVATFINANLFDTPMEQKEVDAIVQSAKEGSGVNDEESEDYRIAMNIIQESRVYKYKRSLYVLESNDPLSWTSDPERLKHIIGEYCKGKASGVLFNVRNQLEHHAKLVSDDKIFPIRFRNGMLKDGEFDRDDDGSFTPYVIDVFYDKDAEPVEIVDEYLKHLTDGEKEYRMVIEEMLGHCLITDPEFKRLVGRFFFLYGSGGNGKGTLLTIISKILNKSNTSNLSPEQMTKEAYSNNMIGKLANLGDDIESSAIDDAKMKILKNISTCDEIQMRNLHKDAYSAVVTCSLIFTTNHTVKSFEKGESFQRRMIWLPMLNKVDEKDPKFISKITSEEAISYWIRLIVEGYIRLYKRGEFTESKRLKEATEAYHRENNNIIEFLELQGERNIKWHTMKDIKDKYETYCEEEDKKPLSQTQLKMAIGSMWGYDNTRNIKHPTMTGKQGRYFVDANYDGTDKDMKAKEIEWLSKPIEG